MSSFLISEAQANLLREWRKQWNLAEGAMKIAEKTNEVFQAPSVQELHYSGRKVVEFLDLIETPSLVHSPDDKLKDAIYDCHRARHDASDHASSVISERLDTARAQFGADAVRQVFPEYAELVAELADVREIIAESREKRNGRGEFYTKIEADHLPKIMKLYEKFKVSEPELENGYIRRLFTEFGVRYGWLIAILLAVLAWLYPRTPG